MTIYDNIKNSVNLLHYLEDNGYKLHPNTSVNNTMVYHPASEEKLLVYDKYKNGSSRGYFHYENVMNPDDKGDIFNFVCNRIDGYLAVDYQREHTGKALKVLKPLAGIAQNDQTPKKEKYTIEKYVKQQNFKKTLQDFNVKPISDTAYLENDRGLSLNILKNPLFEGRLYNSYYQLKNTGHTFVNTAFARGTKENPSGYEVVFKVPFKKQDIHKKSNVGEPTDFFYSNLKNPNKPLALVFYGESAIDILSYAELLFERKNFDKQTPIFLVSLAGNLYESKQEKLLELFKSLPIDSSKTKFVSITDNDKVGFHYDFKITAALINEFKMPCEFRQDNTLFYALNFKEKDIAPYVDTLKNDIRNFNQHVDQTLELLPKEKTLGAYMILKKEKVNEEDFYSLKLPTKHLYKEQLELITKVLKTENLYVAHKPIQKNIDWNDYLQLKNKTKSAEDLNRYKDLKAAYKEHEKQKFLKTNDTPTKKKVAMPKL